VSHRFVSVVRQSTLEVCTVWPAAEALPDSSVTWKAVKRAQIQAVKEPASLLRSDGKHPDWATLIPWVKGEIDGLGRHCAWYFRGVPSELHCSQAGSGSQTGSRQQDCKVSGTWVENMHIFSQLLSRQQDHGWHGASKPLNWCKKSGDESQSSQRTAEKRPSCFRAVH